MKLVMAEDPITDNRPIAEPLDWKGTARYEVLGCLGRGGMGVVYEAFDHERRQRVAVKTLLNYDPAALYLMKQEFRALADVLHANLVHLYELVIPTDGGVFFTMELVQGVEFLRYVRAESGPVSAPSVAVHAARLASANGDTVRPMESGVVELARAPTPMLADEGRVRSALVQLARGVNAVHAAGKLHRDIKPSNVLVTDEGRVVLLDFGVATELGNRHETSISGGGEIVGTALYMAPEQAYDEPPTPASDWYSVGVMLYEALVGRTPFLGSAIDVLTMKSSIDPAPPSEWVDGVPSDLDALCQALLHRDPGARPTGDQILRRLGARDVSDAPPAHAGASDVGAAFIGREKQLQALGDAFMATRSGGPVTVWVGGASGMGKSTIAHRFLDELVDDGAAVVLRGRAYEREAVPYKAVDSVVDALSRHLVQLVELEPDFGLPDDFWAVAGLFPVLQRIPGAERAVAARHAEDPHAVRRRAFEALRELLASLAKRGPLVLLLDDVHWGDVDSASLLLELLRGPTAPPLLVVMTFRENEAQTSPFLLALQERWPEEARRVKVTVGPLAPDDAQRLALSLMNGSDDTARRVATAVARESRGSPFLIEELVRSNRGAANASGAALAVPTLDQMVSERLDQLPDDARRVIEILAVGGRPLPVSVLGTAAGVTGSVNQTISLLGAGRFARTGQRDGLDVVEMAHDRIRETLVGLLPAATLREHHGALARALEASPGENAEAIAVHWLGAGDAARAVRFAEDAAERSTKKLAFDRAAGLIRLALANTPPSSEHAQALRERLAASLQEGGRYGESAQAYMDAAAGAPEERRLEFQRAAAEQLLTAGRIEEGSELLHRVLAAVGMRAPRSPLAAVFWVLVYRLWLAALGLRFREREPSEVRYEDRVRIDLLFAASSAFAMVNVVLGACMQTRHLIEALRFGDRFQVMRAASIEAAHLCAEGGRESARERALVALSRRLAAHDGTPAADAYSYGARGIGLFQRGRWREARESIERGEAVLVYGNSGFSNIHLFSVYTVQLLGHFEECGPRTAKLLVDAKDRGDLYTQVNLYTSTEMFVALAADDPERARRGAREALAQWPQGDFLVQHWQATAYRTDADLYSGDARAGYEALKQIMPRLRRSFLLQSVYIRVMTRFVLARAAIATIPSWPEKRGARIAEARRLAKQLEREVDAWPKCLAAQVRACAANAEGDRVTAIAELRLALERVESRDEMYAWIPSHRLGLLLGGDEGRARVQQALADMTRHGIRNPERWLSVYSPGEWGPAVDGRNAVGRAG